MSNHILNPHAKELRPGNAALAQRIKSVDLNYLVRLAAEKQHPKVGRLSYSLAILCTSILNASGLHFRFINLLCIAGALDRLFGFPRPRANHLRLLFWATLSRRSIAKFVFPVRDLFVHSGTYVVQFYIISQFLSRLVRTYSPRRSYRGRIHQVRRHRSRRLTRLPGTYHTE
jgi:hypothetical protein